LFWTLSVLLYHFIFDGHIANGDVMITLEAVDTVMIATLVKMIITGSYHSFVDNDGQPNESSSSGMLKVKLATSIMVCIHLLQSFISAECVDWDVIYKQLIIHCAFIIGCLALAYVDYLHCKSESHK
jgi:uncharacterized protein (TIGR00645 family)